MPRSRSTSTPCSRPSAQRSAPPRSARRFVIAFALLLGCGGGAAARDAVVVASGADLESANPLVTIHPAARQVQRYVLFVTLARYDDALEPSPYLASRWEWSSDRRTLTFALVRGLRWHDGVPTTARDVAFTLDAARDPATGFPRAADLAALETVETPNDTAITLRFARALPRFPSILCELPIVPAHLLEHVPRTDFRRHAFATTPVGNGPFRFVDRRPGQRWVFERVADFPATMGGPPRLRQVIIAVVDEPTTKFAALVSGDVDVAGIPPTMAELVRDDPSLGVVSYPVTFSTALVFNSSRPPFADVRVRKAIDGAINRERIVQVALAGYATPAAGPVPPEHPYTDSTLLRRLRENHEGEVDRLLDEAGWLKGAGGVRSRNGSPFRFSLLTVGSGDNALEQLIQADLRRHGVQVEISQMELGAFLAVARANPKRFDALVTGIPGDLSLSHIAAMFDGAQRGGALDYAGYHEPHLDSLFRAVREATSPENEAAAWRAVQRALAERVPVAWLYHARGVQGINRRLQGVRMDLRGELPTVAQWTIGPLPGAR